MNPYDEQRLRDEVIYLHSLWHLGPPGNANQNPVPRPRPRPENPSTSTTILHTPTHTTPFKRKKKKKKSGKQQTSSSNTSESASGRNPGPEWPINPSPPATTGWPEVKPMTRPEPLSAEDQAKMLAMKVQQRSIKSCIVFFSKRADEESEDGESEELGEEDYLTEKDKHVDIEVYEFLLELFINDEQLRAYYEKNYEGGDFSCLICFGIGKRVNKRYKDCLGLVQHSTAISKTKRRAHRAFGQIVCKVLGWDIDRLPVIVLKGEPLGKCVMNSAATQDPATRRDNEINEEHTVVQNNGNSKGGHNGEVIGKNVTDVADNNGDMMTCENSLKVDDVNKCDENSDSKVLTMEADNEIGVNFHTQDTDDRLKELDSKFMNPEVSCKESSPSCVANSEWLCTSLVDENSSIATGWPTLKPKRSLVIHLTSAEEQAKLSAFQMQRNLLDVCREFFVDSAGSDSDKSDDEDEGDLMDENGSKESEVFNFFLKLFTENSEFRSYYEKNNQGGEFCCLVCGGIGKKVWRRFKDCHGLLQHSAGMLKTKKKRAHRAFGQVVCKVLAWDFESLPAIVSKGEPLGDCLAKLGVSQVEADINAGGNKDVLSAPMDNAEGQLPQKEESNLHSNNDPLIASETSTNEGDTDKHVNNVQDGSLEVEVSKTIETSTLDGTEL